MKTVIVTCDICRKQYNDKESWVDATVYGAEAHLECVDKLNFFETLQFLSIDEVVVIKNGEGVDTHPSNMRGLGLIK